MASDQTYEKVLTAADIDDRINIPAAVRDKLFWDVAENSKTDVRMVDEKGDSHDMVLTVRKNRTKPAFMAKGSSDFVKKRKLLPGDVLLFSRCDSPHRVKVQVQERAPRPASTLPAFGSDHPPIKPPAAAPVALGLGGLSIGFDHGPVEQSEAVPQGVRPSLSMARFPPCKSLGIIKAEVEEEGPKLQVAPFSQDESTPERPVALSLSRTCKVMRPPTPVQGPTADLSFLAKAGDPGFLYLGSPATNPRAGFYAMARSPGHGFSAKAGCHELRRPKPTTALQRPAEHIGIDFLTESGHVLPEPTPPAAVLDQMAARGMKQPSTNMLQEPPKKHPQDEQPPARIKLFGVYV